jgi:chemotaxis methyl-accepting protein methylase
MLTLSPSADDRDAQQHLDLLVTPRLTAGFCSSTIHRLHERFQVYAASCPVPIPSAGLIITPEIRRQCETYLPLAEIVSAFYRLYQAALSYPPLVQSTPFYTALSWADAFAALPLRFQNSANPASLLKGLLADQELLKEFLFASFLPRRFYGGFRRYPRQREFMRAWLNNRTERGVLCLDAACGTGEDSYGLALLLLENGRQPEEFRIEGWTIEPLEVWSAAHARFPHDQKRQAAYRRETEEIFRRKANDRILFRTIDLRVSPSGSEFDLILCNGLLGGPILNKPHDVQRVVDRLAWLLAPGGILLAADSFHGGWKQKHPQDWLRVQFESAGLIVGPAGEGICASKGIGNISDHPSEVDAPGARQ